MVNNCVRKHVGKTQWVPVKAKPLIDNEIFVISPFNLALKVKTMAVKGR